MDKVLGGGRHRALPRLVDDAGLRSLGSGVKYESHGHDEMHFGMRPAGMRRKRGASGGPPRSGLSTWLPGPQGSG